MEGSSDLQEIFDESSVIVQKSNKCLYSLFIARGSPLLHSLNLLWIYLDHPPPYNEAQVSYFFFFKEAFGFLEVEVVFSKPLQHLMSQPSVPLEVIGEYEDVVEINNDMSPIDEVSKDVIHHSLEGGR